MQRNKKGQYRKLTVVEALKSMLDKFGNDLMKKPKKRTKNGKKKA